MSKTRLGLDVIVSYRIQKLISSASTVYFTVDNG